MVGYMQGSKRARNTPSIANQTSIFGIMGGLAPRTGTSNVSVYRHQQIKGSRGLPQLYGKPIDYQKTYLKTNKFNIIIIMTEFKISHDDDIIKSDEGLVFNPYNSNNVEITLNQVQSILTRYGVPGKVNNLALYKRAFVHKSYTKRPQLYNLQENITITEQPVNCLPLHTKSNERLEFLGDGVLECITKYYLYRRFPKENEGFMTEKKIALVKNESIGKLALEMGLHKYYIISKHAEEKKTRTNLKKLGCLFESFLGALFLDFNKIQIKDEDSWFESVFCYWTRISNSTEIH